MSIGKNHQEVCKSILCLGESDLDFFERSSIAPCSRAKVFETVHLFQGCVKQSGNIIKKIGFLRKLAALCRCKTAILNVIGNWKQLLKADWLISTGT